MDSFDHCTWKPRITSTTTHTLTNTPAPVTIRNILEFSSIVNNLIGSNYLALRSNLHPRVTYQHIEKSPLPPLQRDPASSIVLHQLVQ